MADKPRGKPLDPQVKERIAWFIGVGATQEEAAGACDVHRSTVAKVMSQPEFRKMADDIQRQRTSMKSEVASILRAGLTAVDSDGDPMHSVRQRAAELYAKNPELFDVDDDEGEDDGMLPGVVILFPVLLDETMPEGTVELVAIGSEEVVKKITLSGVDTEREDSTLPTALIQSAEGLSDPGMADDTFQVTDEDYDA